MKLSKLKRHFPLTKVRINNFLEQFISDYIFDVKYGTDKDCEGAPACLDENDTIWINKSIFYRYSILEQKAILLHEAGHIAIGYLRSVSSMEYHAQLWAMKEAKSRGMVGLYKELEDMIISWSLFEWNEDKGIWRPYIKASRKYLKIKHEKKKTKTASRVRSKTTTVGKKCRGSNRIIWNTESRF